MSLLNTKRNIFIISAGRTGTEFFGSVLNSLSNEIVAVHEPDRVSLEKSRKKELREKINRHGILELIVLKALGISGTRNHSLKRVSNKITQEAATRKIISERSWIPKDKIYIESNWQLFGLIDELLTLENSKIIILIRDPRTWVRSWMNKGYWYDEKDRESKLNILGFKRINPKNVGIKNDEWKNYDRFEKLCWVWNYLNQLFLEKVKSEQHNMNILIYEDIFINKNEDAISLLIKTIFENEYSKAKLETFRNSLKIKVNSSVKHDFPGWKKWKSKHVNVLHKHCGVLMKQLGFGNEKEWLNKIT